MCFYVNFFFVCFYFQTINYAYICEYLQGYDFTHMICLHFFTNIKRRIVAIDRAFEI